MKKTKPEELKQFLESVQSEKVDKDYKIPEENKQVLDLMKKLQAEKKPAQTFFFSEQALASIMFILQNAVQNALLDKSDEEVDVSKMLANLELVASSVNGKIYVKNPPSVLISPEVEEKMKQEFLKRMNQKV